MIQSVPGSAANFFVAGINYKKTDASARGLFAINDYQYERILNIAPSLKLSSLFILSTCNRTEIYGCAEDAGQLISLLCTETKGTKDVFASSAYIKQGLAAVEHLFYVGAGLDSQLLGDYEIIGQLKNAVKFSKDRGFMNCFLERLFNTVLQSSKTIKNETLLSSGTVSVSFAAVQYIKENTNPGNHQHILVIGTGKIGRNTCKNLVDYLGTKNITLINRSEGKAAKLAAELHLKYASISELDKYIASSDVILLATNAAEPVILKSHLENRGTKLIVDMSVPYNVEASAAALSNVTIVNVDRLSVSKDETLSKRMAEIPAAEKIVREYVAEFMDWNFMRKNAAVLKAIKLKLNQIHLRQSVLNTGHPVFPFVTPKENIQRVINCAASKMRLKDERGCHYLEAINDFMIAVSF